MADEMEGRDGQCVIRKNGKDIFDREDGEFYIKLGSYLCLLGKALVDRNVEEFSYAMHALDNTVANDRSEALARLLEGMGWIELIPASDQGITLEDLTVRASFEQSSDFSGAALSRLF